MISNFYIFRHGITLQSKNLLEYGDNEETASILDEAFPSLQKMGLYLKDIKTGINLTSPYKRCLETVKIVSEFSGKEFSIDARLGEYRADLEDFPKFFARIKNLLDELTKQKYQSVLLCSHGYPISAIRQYLSGKEIDIARLEIYPKPGVLSIFKDGKVNEVDFNI